MDLIPFQNPRGRRLPRGVPCSPGCAAHITHPCENCGRIAAGWLPRPVTIDPEVAAEVGLRLCCQCHQRPVVDRPNAKLCGVCFLRAMDLAFYELDRAEARGLIEPDPDDGD